MKTKFQKGDRVKIKGNNKDIFIIASFKHKDNMELFIGVLPEFFDNKSITKYYQYTEVYDAE